MTLADARAREPMLEAVPHEPKTDAALLDRIMLACDRLSPMVAVAGTDALVIDISGCAHLAGGEGALADEAAALLARIGVGERHALGDTPEAALALARHQTLPAPDEATALRRLPVVALELEEAAETALRRAGLRSIGDLADRPTAPLAARFGEEAVAALDRLLGRADSRIVPLRPAPALFRDRRFAEPLGHVETAMAALGDLVREAGAVLEERQAGGRRFAVRFYRSDGMLRDLAVETSLPTRDPAVIMRLFAERIEALSDPIDPGFGFDMLRLAVPLIEPLAPTQLDLSGGSVGEDVLATLIDRLGVRHGRARIHRFAPGNSHLPEQGVLALPLGRDAAPERAAWPVPEQGEPPHRPIHLFDPPHPIEVMAEVPDGPPHRFRWRRQFHEVRRYEGPERIAAEWWRQAGEAALTRDYYRVEDARGRRFWIFRHGLYGAEAVNPRWYVHGLFA